ncbi:MAG: alpha/beta hydrolase [Candidatus Buchananbacteria bacterium]
MKIRSVELKNGTKLSILLTILVFIACGFLALTHIIIPLLTNSANRGIRDVSISESTSYSGVYPKEGSSLMSFTGIYTVLGVGNDYSYSSWSQGEELNYSGHLVASGDILSFWTYIVDGPGCGLSIDFSDGTKLPITTQDQFKTPLVSNKYLLRRWLKRNADISSMKGKTIKSITLAQENDRSLGNYRCLFDGIKIENSTKDLRIIKDISYGSLAKQKLDLYLPKDYNLGSPKPTILLIHGGGYMLENKEWWKYYAVDLANRGYIVIANNYRLSPALIPDMLEDCKSALNWILSDASIRNYNIDKTRIGLIGSSSGGHFANLLATMPETRGKINTAVIFYGISDLITNMGNPYKAYPGENGIAPAVQNKSAVLAQLINQLPENEGQGDVKSWYTTIANVSGLGQKLLGVAYNSSSPGVYLTYSPLNYINTTTIRNSNFPKFMIVHGKKDIFVEFSQSARMENLLKKVGASVETNYYDGSNHGFLEINYPLMVDEWFPQFYNFILGPLMGYGNYNDRLGVNSWNKAALFLDRQLLNLDNKNSQGFQRNLDLQIIGTGLSL